MRVIFSSTPVAVAGTGEPLKARRKRLVAPAEMGATGMRLPFSSVPRWTMAPPSLARVSTARKGERSVRLPRALAGGAVGVTVAVAVAVAVLVAVLVGVVVLVAVAV